MRIRDIFGAPRVDTMLHEASSAFAGTMRSAAAMALQREDIGWAPWGGENQTEDVVPVGTIKAHSIRARRLAAYNPLVKRGLVIRNAYMWSEQPHIDSTEPVAEDQMSTSTRSRDEAALCTDGIVLYVCDPAKKTAAPVPLSRIEGVARAHDALSEDDIFAFLVKPVPVNPDPSRNPETRKPEWVIVDGHPATQVKGSQYKTNTKLRAVYLSVNRQTGEEWGKPDLLGAVYWAQAYKEYLEAAYTLSKALARIAFKSSSSTQKQQQAVIAQMGGLQGAGATASLAQGQELTAVSKAGAGIEFGAGSPLAAMVSAALDVPLSVLLTDGSAGGRQGAESALEEPTFKAFEMRRQLHADLIRRILSACGIKAEVRLGILSNELVQRWGQVLTLLLQNGVLWPEEVRGLALKRFRPENARGEEELPPKPELAVMDTGNSGGTETGVGPLSDGTNANRDEDGGETVA